VVFTRDYLAWLNSASHLTSSLQISKNSFSLLFASSSLILNFKDEISSDKELILSASDSSLSLQIQSVSILSSKNS
jgi:hypothetical protein